MNELLLHIDYLLRDHECVTIPGMGALIASVTPATVADSGLITPPVHVLAFNSHINHNDGLLVGSYARRYNISAEEAWQRVSHDVGELYDSMRAGHREPVGLSGWLRFDQTSGLVFDRAETVQWLQPLQLQPVLDIARSESAQDTALERGRGLAAGLRRLRIAASVAVALAIGFVVSTPTIVGDDTQVASPMLGQFTPKAPSYTHSTPILIKATTDPMAVQQAVICESVSEPAKTPADEEQPASLRLNESDRYFLIVASLGSAREAAWYIARQQQPMKMLDTDGRFRVYALSGNSSAALKSEADRLGLAAKYPGAWVYHN